MDDKGGIRGDYDHGDKEAAAAAAAAADFNFGNFGGNFWFEKRRGDSL